MNNLGSWAMLYHLSPTLMVHQSQLRLRQTPMHHSFLWEEVFGMVWSRVVKHMWINTNKWHIENMSTCSGKNQNKMARDSRWWLLKKEIKVFQWNGNSLTKLVLKRKKVLTMGVNWRNMKHPQACILQEQDLRRELRVAVILQFTTILKIRRSTSLYPTTKL